MSQVSSSQLPALARLAAGRLSQSVAAPMGSEAALSNGSPPAPEPASSVGLDLEDFK